LITDFATLQSEAANEAQRRDLATIMPSLVQRAEAAIFRELALYGVGLAVTGSATGGVVPLPADVDAIDSLTIDVHGRAHSLDYIPTNDGMLMAGGGVPRWYTVASGAIVLLPAPASDYAYTLRYAQQMAPLSDANPSNWILTKAPDVYLYRVCIQIGIHTHDDALIQRHTQFYQDAIQALRNEDARARLPRVGGLRMRPRGAV
jgi:hypothetical protein